MKNYTLLIAFGVSLLSISSCQKSDVSNNQGGGSTGNPSAADSFYRPGDITWSEFGFGSNFRTVSVGAAYNANHQVTQIGGYDNAISKPHYYADGRLSYILEQSYNAVGNLERSSAIFKYSGNKIIKIIYKQISTLPESDPWYSDTIRTDNNNGYYDSLIYTGNNLTRIDKRNTFFIPYLMSFQRSNIPMGQTVHMCCNKVHQLQDFKLRSREK